ncbi:DUF3667 domain-containing protein [Psychroflexus tropicus]|uniref:DUF3667 domain-containing protein n=1 Tax=Psychroflexus tropicus TaxID=197345 RepID=UPI00039A37D1|nr:DUF3667 domain-containing protein [Psychroflexus tropicus]
MKDDFCSNCQSQATLKRINGRYIVSEIMSVLNFEKGFFYTMKELALRPDQCIQNFILNDRKRLVKPITFVIFCSLFYTLVKQNIYDRFLEGFGEGYTDSLGLEASVLINILGWLKQNYGFTNIFISVFIVSWIKLFFKKYNYNFFEILILLLYVTGMGTLVYSVFALLEIVTGLEISYLGTAITLAYYAWAIGRFFDKRKRINYFKALITYILGILTFYFFTILVGTIIDFILYF